MEVEKEKTVEKQPVVAEPKVESVKPEQEVEKTEEKDDNLFRLNSVKLESKIKVTGKIDLDALNQSTRPKKKTKEEKRKERDEKQSLITIGRVIIATVRALLIRVRIRLL